MPITFDYYMGRCEYKYTSKNIEDGHRWIVFADSQEELDKELVRFGYYDECYNIKTISSDKKGQLELFDYIKEEKWNV